MGLTVNRQMAQKLTVNGQKRNIFTVNRQMSEPKLARQISQISLNDRDRLTKWGHRLVGQVINTSSGNGGGVITLIIHIVVIVGDQ